MMREIVFQVEPGEPEGGGWQAHWADPGVGGIATSGDTYEELRAMIADAVALYFEDKPKPDRVRLQLVEDLLIVPGR